MNDRRKDKGSLSSDGLCSWDLLQVFWRYPKNVNNYRGITLVSTFSKNLPVY